MIKESKLEMGLSYDDVLIVPKYSQSKSRKDIDIKTKFSRNVKLNMPIVSANMDTVTESDMAIAIAREGGIGVVHQFMSLEKQVQEIRRVKRAESLIIHDPITIGKEALLTEALGLMRHNDINGLLVVDEKGFLEGILTSRDIRFLEDLNTTVGKVMTARPNLITASFNIKTQEAIKIFARYKIEKLPLVDKRGFLRGLMTAADFIKIKTHIRAAKDRRGRLVAAAAIGVKNGLERAPKLVDAGADALVIDVAHGHHILCVDLLKKIKMKFKNVDVVAGNIATAEAARDLIKAGADAIKVGIGPGSACSTRVIAGAGVPQISAVLRVAQVAHKYNVPLIADGGIKNSGDLAKAVAAGASSTMIGSLFAGTLESPGEYYIEDGEAVKIYRGSASRDMSADRSSLERNADRAERAPEGVSTRVSYRGEVKKIMTNLIDGLQSGMSYSGATTIQDFWQKAEFIKMTEAGMKESRPRY